MGGPQAGSPGREPAGSPTGDADFEIRIRGRMGESYRSAFAELTVVTRPAETALLGRGLDQAALYAVIDRIQALGLELLEVRRLTSPSDSGS